MVRIAVLLLASAGFAANSWAGPACIAASLSDYIALGSDGCSIGAFRVFDFSETDLSFGTERIESSGITVNPTFGGSFGSLMFSAMVESFSTAFESAILYSVSGPLVGTRLSLGEAKAVDTGVALVLQEFCLDGDFSAGFCSGVSVDQAVFQVDGDQEKSVFSPLNAKFAGIRQSIVADGGPFGSASFGSAQVTFATPEPSALLLTLGGLAGLCGMRLRRRGAERH